jgi:small subunit ribosomal protein S27Ae
MADKKAKSGKGRDKKEKSGVVAKDYYDVKDGKLIRTRKSCPKCGLGVFLAQHKNRLACGKCGYTEFTEK